jgi:hypothetical protein
MIKYNINDIRLFLWKWYKIFKADKRRLKPWESWLYL